MTMPGKNIVTRCTGYHHLVLVALIAGERDRERVAAIRQPPSGGYIESHYDHTAILAKWV